MMDNGTGFTRVINAARCSFAGVGYAFRHEAAFRQEVVLTLILVPVALWLTPHAIERVALIGPLLLLLCIECVNSAIEAAIDRISTSRHPLSKQAKDLGSAAVFFCMLLVGLTWLLVALPKLL